MKIAMLAESFLPHMNGVTRSVLQVRRCLEDAGHEVRVVAPSAGDLLHPVQNPDDEAAAMRVPSVPLPHYPQVRLATVTARRLARELRSFDPDVVHLASPFLLGWRGVLAAEQLDAPSVAIYQTDVISYAQRYGISGAAPLAAAHVRRLHRRATLTLVPSSPYQSQLSALGIDRLRRWGRGVDTARFQPGHRDEVWRSEIGHGRVLVGYVGRLAPEKQVEDLRALHDVPGVQIVIVGDGPSRGLLQRMLPHAHFTGHLHGGDLSRAMASLDVFVHPGESETFCQTVQEAQASGVPVVATGRGGPVDLVTSSVDGWLFRPGDLGDLRDRVADLAGDAGKRRAFADAAHRTVAGRTWGSLTSQLLGHYEEALSLHAARAHQDPRSTPGRDRRVAL